MLAIKMVYFVLLLISFACFSMGFLWCFVASASKGFVLEMQPFYLMAVSFAIFILLCTIGRFTGFTLDF